MTRRVSLGHKKKTLYASRVRAGDAYLVILDGEKDESIGILLEQWLVGLEVLGSFSGGSNMGLLGLWLGSGLLGFHDALGDGGVFLVRNVEVELLDRRIAHLEGLEGRGSLEDAYPVSASSFDA